MSLIDYLAGVATGSLTVLMLLVLHVRFRKPGIDRFTATLEAAPGKSRLTLTRGGLPVAKVVLSRVIMSSHSGTTAEFTDYTRYISDRTVR